MDGEPLVTGGRDGGCRMGVPAYFHPCRAGSAWSLLTAEPWAAAVGLVVINPDSGVGAAPDAAYRRACTVLRRPGRIVAGYVDTAYATRPAGDVLAEAAAYQDRYGLSAVFVDQVSSGRPDLAYYGRLARALRASGTGTLLFNPGVVPLPAYLDLADVVVTFEGPWTAYRAQEPPGADRRAHRAAAWHLVHSTPAHDQPAALATAARRADYAYVTERTMPNPWDDLPLRWPALVAAPPARSRAVRGEGP